MEDPPSILVLGDSNFTRGPFTRHPYVNVAKPGLRVAQAAHLLQNSHIDRPVDAILIGVGVNDRGASQLETVRTGFQRLQDTLQTKYPGKPVYYVDTPAEKFGLDPRTKARLHNINTIGASFFKPIHYKAQDINTGDPHYTPEERNRLARLCNRLIRP